MRSSVVQGIQHLKQADEYINDFIMGFLKNKNLNLSKNYFGIKILQINPIKDIFKKP